MNTQMRGSVPEASGEASGPEGGDSNMGTAPTSGPEATSSQGKHTPGPWDADDGDGQYFGVFGPDGGGIAYLVEPKTEIMLPTAQSPQVEEADAWRMLREHKANARLIAAAPELLAALQLATDLLANPGIPTDRAAIEHAIVEGRAAIAKATQP